MNGLEIAGIVVESVGVLPMARYFYLVYYGHRNDKPGTDFDGDDFAASLFCGVLWPIVLVVSGIVLSVTWHKEKE